MRITTPVFRDHFQRRQLVLDALRIGTFQVDLVDRNNERSARGFGVLDGLLGLWHDTVICGNNQNDNIRSFRAPCTHGGKRRVAGRVQEGEPTLPHGNAIGTDMLGDAARFAARHFGFTDVVQQ